MVVVVVVVVVDVVVRAAKDRETRNPVPRKYFVLHEVFL